MPEFRQLAEGVYAYLQPPLVWYSNAGVVVGDRDVTVIDSLGNAAMARDLLERIRQVTDKPVRFLVNTHSHADHVYTNHLFPGAVTIATHKGREWTGANVKAQDRHSATFARLFPEVDFEGGRYTLQEMSFTGSLSLYQGEREICVMDLGVGHSEADAVVHLPGEGIVFCGDLFMNGMAPMPLEGHVSQTIANCRVLEDLQAGIYVAGHGPPGSLAEVRAQRTQLEGLFQHARECFERGLGYDEALQAPGGDLPMDFRRLAILSAYCELAGRRPETADPASRDHLAVLQGMAREARLALQRRNQAP